MQINTESVEINRDGSAFFWDTGKSLQEKLEF